MAKYVDVEKEFCDYCGDRDRCGSPNFFCSVKSMVAADVEEVTRCKDCYQSCYVGGSFGESLFCTYWGKDTDENGYCHEGG